MTYKTQPKKILCKIIFCDFKETKLFFFVVNFFCAAVCLHFTYFDLLDNIETTNNITEDHVFPIKPVSFVNSDEKLRTVGIRT